MNSPHLERNPHPAWNHLARRFADDKECLATFLALETAALLEGVKPGNLINVLNRPQKCGKNLYLLWRRYGQDLLRDRGLVAWEMVDRGKSVLLFIFRPEALEALLQRRDVAAVLFKAGYPEPLTLETSIAELQSRIRAGGTFPHEVGVFLGYPLKDVVAFMGWAPIPFACQGPWKIYGDPDASLKLADTFLSCRLRMARRLTCCASPLECLAPCVTGMGRAVNCFGVSIDTERQNQRKEMSCASQSSAGLTVWKDTTGR